MRTYAKSLSTIALAGALALSASACGSSSDDEAATSSSSSSAAAPEPTAAPTPAAQLSDLSKGKTTAVTLDAGFVQALMTLKLTPAPDGKATISKAGVATFPITGGNATYYDPASGVTPYVQGKIDHKGSGLSLTGGGKKVVLGNFVVDPGTSMLTGDVSVNGKTAAKGADLFTLDGTTLKPLSMEGTDAILEGTKVEISPAAAELLNTPFGTTAVKPGLLVGIAKITLATA